MNIILTQITPIPLMAVFIGLMYSTSLVAEEPTDTQLKGNYSKDNVLLVLSVNQDTPYADLEIRYTEELGLSLDDIDVRLINKFDSHFNEQNLGTQISMVRPVIAEHGAVAAVWLHQTSSNLLMLHIVAVSSGRALARVVELTPVEGIEADLAMAARELLSTAFMFHQQTQPDAPQLMSPAPQPIADCPEPTTLVHQWSLLASPLFSGAIAGHTGPHISMGGTLWLDVPLLKIMHVRFLLSSRGGYLDNQPPADLSSWSVEPGLGLSVNLQRKRFQFHPGMSVRFEWIGVTATRTNASDESWIVQQFKFGLDLDTRFKLARHFGIWAGGSFLLSPERQRFVRESVEDEVMVTPSLSFEIRFGVFFPLGRNKIES